MKTQALEIELLSEAGWRISCRTNELNWRADEQWCVKSVWSPVGFSVYITFLVDPVHDGPRKNSEALWAASINLTPPSDRFAAEHLVVLRERNLTYLVQSATSLGDAYIAFAEEAKFSKTLKGLNVS